MAKYLILIYGDEQEWTAASPAELREKGEAHGAFAEAAGPGLLIGAQLESASAATTLRPGSNGSPVITDGPFLETKEVLGGYYLLEAPDLDAAISLASRLPELSERAGAIEVRPIHENA
jgi:hypothetical protein